MTNHIRKKIVIILFVSVIVLSACKEGQTGEEKAYVTEEHMELKRNEGEKSDPERKVEIPQLDQSLLEEVAGIGTESANEYFLAALQYQISLPCSFVMYADGYSVMDVNEFRNINKDNISDEYGDVRLKHVVDAHMADAALDKYIREYGGEDTKYHIRNVLEEKLQTTDKAFPHTCVVEVFNEDITLTVTYNTYYCSIIIVSIDGMEDEVPHTQEYLTYLLHAYRYRDDVYTNPKQQEDYFWMLIDPEMKKENYDFRNVDPDGQQPDGRGKVCGILEYYIADQVIDKYIRVYGGTDVRYRVKLTGKEEGISEGTYKYTMLIENDVDDMILMVEYDSDTWFAEVTMGERICDSNQE